MTAKKKELVLLREKSPYVTLTSTNGESVVFEGTLKEDGRISVKLGQISTLEAVINSNGLGDVRIDGGLPLPVKKLTINVEAGKNPEYTIELVAY